MEPIPLETESIASKVALVRSRRLLACPESAKKLLARCYAGKCSPRAAVKAFCQECCGYEREAITGCMAYGCPLWNLRPYQKEGVNEA